MILVMEKPLGKMYAGGAVYQNMERESTLYILFLLSPTYAITEAEVQWMPSLFIREQTSLGRCWPVL